MMCERLDAVRELQRQAHELTAACACALVATLYDGVLDEPIPEPIQQLVDQLSNDPADPRH